MKPADFLAFTVGTKLRDQDAGPAGLVGRHHLGLVT